VAGTVQYIITPTSTPDGCAGVPFTITITVSPKPSVTTPATSSICSGGTTSINLTASIASDFDWTIGAITGGITGASAGSGTSISQTLTNPGNASAGTVQYIVTPTSTAGSCPGNPYTITVTVNPIPLVTTAPTKTICSGNGANISLAASAPSSFTWTIGTITGGITGASAASGSTINQVLTNPSNASDGTVEYIVTPTSTTGSCPGTPYTITVTVSPKPVVTNNNTFTICTGDQTNIGLTSNIPSTFTWTIGTITGSITGAIAGSASTINQTLNNPSNTITGTVQYLVTPTSTGGLCPGSPFTITVTVSPKPAVTNPATASVCSGNATSINLTSSIPASFDWTIGTITGGITGASAGSGSSITQTLINPSNATAGTVQYLITPTSTTGSCPGTLYTITVTVNPKPDVTSSNTASICSGTAPGINLTSSVPSTFSWTIGSITGGITGASAGSGSIINQTLTNPGSTASGTVQYIITPTSFTGSCPGNPYTITVTVNRAPTLTNVSQDLVVCAGNKAPITLTGLVPGTTATISYLLGSTPYTVIVTADNNGKGTFLTEPVSSSDKTLTITSINITSFNPSCTKAFNQSININLGQPLNSKSDYPIGPAAACEGDQVSFSVTGIGQQSNIGVGWEYRPDANSPWSAINFGTTTVTTTGNNQGNFTGTLTFIATASMGSFQIRGTFSNGACDEQPTGAISLIIKPRPTLILIDSPTQADNVVGGAEVIAVVALTVITAVPEIVLEQLGAV